MLAILLFTLAALVCSATVDAQSLALLSDRQYAESFASWLTARNHTYTQSDFSGKFATYKANHAYVSAHNARYQQGLEAYQLALNEYADLTVDEYRARLGYRRPQAQATSVSDRGTEPFDWADWMCQYYGVWCPKQKSSSSSTGGVGPASESSSSSSTGVDDVASSSTGAAPESPSSSVAPAESSSAAPSVSSSSTSASVPSSSSNPFVRLSSSTGSRVQSSSTAPSVQSSSAAPAPANSKDWRGSGLLGPVKNQGQCGSCWSFASTASMQSAWAVKSGQLLSFSEQQLMDCAANGQNTCDRGGFMQDSWDWLLGSSSSAAKKSPMTEAAYPYTGNNGGCKYDASKSSGATFTRSVDIAANSESALLTASQTIPAVAVAIDASTQAFQFYSSGVLTDSGCSANNLNHAVTVVGYGTDNGVDYWLVQNSWGQSWGDQGYLKMRRNYNNMCGIASEASYIVA